MKAHSILKGERRFKMGFYEINIIKQFSLKIFTLGAILPE
jgi:hypothetical protein